MKPKEVLEFAKKNKVAIVDMRFIDFVGMWQHFSVPINQLTEDSFEDGFGFDGSSIRAWQAIHMSDMLLMPDPATTRMDPFLEVPTMFVICNVVDPITKERYTRDPRNIAQKAEAYLKSTGIGDQIFFGPEAEFFVFDDVRYDQTEHSGYYYVDSVEGSWNTGRDEKPNLGYKPRYKEGYFPVPPSDTMQDLRSRMVLAMEGLGIEIEAQHHEVATGGQCEIDMRFDTLTSIADKLTIYKYVVKNVAWKHGKTATFMPKPIFMDNGSGMHCHQSIWKGGKPLFAGDEYAGLSKMALHYIGGILKHANALVALTSPTTNSFKRLVPGFEAPVNLCYSSRNRSASIRIPMYSASPKAKRVEVRFPDPACNPYIAFSAMMMAGLDGIENKIDPGEPQDKDLYELEPEKKAGIPTVPDSLDRALNALEKDHEFMLKGDVFTNDVISAWINYKREKEVDALRLRPHPYEFKLYYDI